MNTDEYRCKKIMRILAATLQVNGREQRGNWDRTLEVSGNCMNTKWLSVFIRVHPWFNCRFKDNTGG